MKKIAIITSAALLLTAAVNAQTDTIPKQEPVPQQQPSATDHPVAKSYNDKYNNWTADTYKMQPMPEALTTEKIFPVLGKYQLTDKEGASTSVTITLDETNKGIVWIEGLPQGKIKAALRKSPATYKIPMQPLGEATMTEEVVDAEKEAKEAKEAKKTKTAKETKAKELPEGVLIYDKDANVLNVCIGCAYNTEEPTLAFTSATEPTEPVEEPQQKKTTKTSKKSTAKAEKKVKPVLYSGSKIMETPAATEQPVQQQ